MDDIKIKRRNLRYNPELKERARKLRNNMTPAEKDLWYRFLRNHKYKFLRQKPIGDYIVDFYCPSLKLVIEIDDESHYGEINERYDNKRTEFLNKLNLKVIRFFNKEVYKGFASVC
jgi:very-short-patch-repair endonuclease